MTESNTPTPPQHPDAPFTPPPWVNTTPPTGHLPHGSGDGLLRNSLFSIYGRMGRLSMLAAFLGLIAWFMLFAFIGGIVVAIAGISSGMSHGSPASAVGMGMGFMALIIISVLALIVYMNIFYVRRLHDLNHSGWWVAAPLALGIIANGLMFIHLPAARPVFIGITLINLLFFAYITLAPGTEGVNRFGPPRYTSTTEKVFGWISAVLLSLDLYFVWSIMHGLGQFPPNFNQSPLAPYSTAATSAPIIGKYTAPYPFDATALWNNLLKVTALPDDTITNATVETAFGTTLHTSDLPMVGPTSITNAGDDWYFALRINDMNMFGVNMKMFTFNWGNVAGPNGLPPPVGMCIRVDEVSPSLLAQGWALTNTPNLAQPTKAYAKPGGGMLKLIYDPNTQCMRQLTLMVTKKAAV